MLWARRVACWTLVMVLGWGALSPSSAWADISLPKPNPQKGAGAPLEVVALPPGQPMRLEIPRALLPEAPEPKAVGIFGDMNGLRTIISGLALSLAAVFGGLWLVRRQGGAGSQPLSRGATVATGTALLVALITVATAWADIPRPGKKSNGGRPMPVPVQNPLGLNLVVVEQGEKLVLYASPADLANLAASARKGPPVRKEPQVRIPESEAPAPAPAAAPPKE